MPHGRSKARISPQQRNAEDVPTRAHGPGVIAARVLTFPSLRTSPEDRLRAIATLDRDRYAWLARIIELDYERLARADWPQ